jgi:hypothetical protein
MVVSCWTGKVTRNFELDVQSLLISSVVSMTLGLPTVISRVDAHAVPLPACIDDVYLSSLPSQDNHQPLGMISQKEFFVQSLKLYVIMEDILSAMYSGEDSISPVTQSDLTSTERLSRIDFNTLLQIEASLQNWYAALPDMLKAKDCAAEDNTEPILTRQATILQLRSVKPDTAESQMTKLTRSFRFLHIKIMLSRPILSLLLTPDVRIRAFSLVRADNWLPLAVALPCARNCVLSATELIRIIHERQNWENAAVIEPLPAWWYEVFCTSTVYSISFSLPKS